MRETQPSVLYSVFTGMFAHVAINHCTCRLHFPPRCKEMCTYSVAQVTSPWLCPLNTAWWNFWATLSEYIHVHNKNALLPEMTYPCAVTPDLPSTKWISSPDRIISEIYWKINLPQKHQMSNMTYADYSPLHNGCRKVITMTHSLKNELRDVGIKDLSSLNKCIKTHHCYKNVSETDRLLEDKQKDKLLYVTLLKRLSLGWTSWSTKPRKVSKLEN